MSKILIIEMPDKSEWAVPVEIIARNRASHYAEEFGGDIERSLKEDTWPLFEEADYEVTDWAANNMQWKELEPYARQIHPPPPMDYAHGLANGKKGVLTSRRPPEGFRELAVGETVAITDSMIFRSREAPRHLITACDHEGRKVSGTEAWVFLRRVEGGAA